MSHDEPQLTRSERELESMLASLKPAAPSFTEAEIAFEAGRRAGRMQLLRWRAAAAILVAALGLSILARPAPRTSERAVVTQDSSRAAQPHAAAVDDRQPYATLSTSPGSYLNLRQLVIERGVDALPTPSASTPSNTTILRAGSSLDELRG